MSSGECEQPSNERIRVSGQLSLQVGWKVSGDLNDLVIATALIVSIAA